MTDFADQAVMLPLACVIGLSWALSGWWRGCAAWVVAVGAVLGTMALLKVVFFACSGLLGVTGIHSPSGHTAASSAIIGGALVLVFRGRLPWYALAGIPVVIAVVFGITRLAVHAHSVPEMIAGGVVGLAGVAVMVGLAGVRPRGRVWPAALAACVILVGLHGVKLEAETALHNYALLAWLPLPSVCRA